MLNLSFKLLLKGVQRGFKGGKGGKFKVFSDNGMCTFIFTVYSLPKSSKLYYIILNNTL